MEPFPLRDLNLRKAIYGFGLLETRGHPSDTPYGIIPGGGPSIPNRPPILKEKNGSSSKQTIGQGKQDTSK